MKTPKLIVVGIDGGGFELIHPWLDNDELPNIKFIVRNGIYGDLMSCLPPVTSPNWKCYSTGKNPGKLGIFWWNNIDVENRRSVYGPSLHQNHTNFWNILNKAGYRTGIINTPLTYPPQEIEGYVIAGGPDAASTGACYPASIEKELSSKFGYKVHATASHNSANRDALAAEILELIESRFKVADYLMEKDETDFIQVTSFYINVLQHFFWNSEHVKEGWKIIDGWIGRFLQKGTNVWVMSDHGSMPVNQELIINSWIAEKGLLQLKKTFTDKLFAMGINQERLKGLAEALKIKPFLKKSIPKSWFNALPDKQGLMNESGGIKKIKWEQTDILGLGQGPLYVLCNKQTEIYQKTIKIFLNELKALTLPDSNQKVVRDIIPADKIYHGPLMKNSPDFVIDYNHGIRITGLLGSKKVFSKPLIWKGENKREGIFLAYGPDMQKSLHASGLSILDLAPTILHLFGVAASEDMDGKVRKDFFSKDSTPGKNDVKKAPEKDLIEDHNTDLSEDEKVMTQRLKDLGYLS
jgi:predicted AlkP superfamily phosphohydrolase/phosphomutase